ncbi:hypothetical protein L3Y34_019163 [Caenorhabditis briggsae]|uniref:Uncharacterized protein n=1 Tax=Caenorhabditis briggsae TaxID=6238 RepID=A0AAE9IWD0_CAEBR|nr:hypothetical protein L3Y34_019163 [Caenorhabditis briggsae]
MTRNFLFLSRLENLDCLVLSRINACLVSRSQMLAFSRLANSRSCKCSQFLISRARQDKTSPENFLQDLQGFSFLPDANARETEL